MQLFMTLEAKKGHCIVPDELYMAITAWLALRDPAAASQRWKAHQSLLAQWTQSQQQDVFKLCSWPKYFLTLLPGTWLSRHAFWVPSRKCPTAQSRRMPWCMHCCPAISMKRHSRWGSPPPCQQLPAVGNSVSSDRLLLAASVKCITAMPHPKTSL